MTNLNDHWRSIKGHFNFSDVYDIAVSRSPQDAIFIEIGSYYGCSACYMASRILESKKNIKLFCVDVWKEMDAKKNCIYYDFLKNTEPFKDIIIPLKMTSVEASKLFREPTFDFIFIDADHSYNAVKTDIASWFPKLKIPGMFGGHDYGNLHGKPPVDQFPGVGVAVREAFGSDFMVSKNTWYKETQ